MNKLTVLKLNDINWTLNDMSDLEPLVELQNKLGDNMFLAGTITITGSWSIPEKDYYESFWNHKITINTTGTKVDKARVVYNTGSYIDVYGNEVPNEVIETRYVDAGKLIPDIYAGKSLDELPKRNPDI